MATKTEAKLGHIVKTIQSLDLNYIKDFSDTTVIGAGVPSERTIVLKFVVFEPEKPESTPEPKKIDLAALKERFGSIDGMQIASKLAADEMLIED